MSIHYYSCINDSPHTLIMELNMQAYFDQLDRVRYEGPKTTNPLAFRHYNPDELVLGKRMEDHLRFAACYCKNPMYCCLTSRPTTWMPSRSIGWSSI